VHLGTESGPGAGLACAGTAPSAGASVSGAKSSYWEKPTASMRHRIAHYIVPAQFASNHTTLVTNTAKLRTAVTTNRLPYPSDKLTCTPRLMEYGRRNIINSVKLRNGTGVGKPRLPRCRTAHWNDGPSLSPAGAVPFQMSASHLPRIASQAEASPRRIEPDQAHRTTACTCPRMCYCQS
jgi:hypothetical protein